MRQISKDPITKLSIEIGHLTGADSSNFKSAAGMAFPIIGQVLQTVAEQLMQAALKKAIETGANPVNKLLDAIETDATIQYERRRNALSAERVIVIDQYNREFQRGIAADPRRLKALADDISAQGDRWEAFSTRPKAALEAMKNANNAIVEFARKQTLTVHDITTLSDAMDAFATIATHFAEVAKELNYTARGGNGST